MWGKDQQFHSFFPLGIYENTFQFFCFFFRLLFFKGTYFKFYLIVVLIYLYFVLYITERIMSLELCGGVFSGQVYCG